MNTDVPEDPRELVEDWEQVVEIGVEYHQRKAYASCASELEAWIEEYYDGGADDE